MSATISSGEEVGGASEVAYSKAPHLSGLSTKEARHLVGKFAHDVVRSQDTDVGHDVVERADACMQGDAIRIGSAAFSAFLQANVTGPALEDSSLYEADFASAYEDLSDGPGNGHGRHGSRSLARLRRMCTQSLDTDGVSVYEYAPRIELFCFARWIFTSFVPTSTKGETCGPSEVEGELQCEVAWARFRIHLWHYKLLSQPVLGPGSVFTKSGRWTDVATLQEQIKTSLAEAEAAVLGPGQAVVAKRVKVLFLLEKCNAHVLLGNDAAAREALNQATEQSGFVYALTGALGKRTKFQEKSISQLVVLAMSDYSGEPERDVEGPSALPDALPLDNDTLLENILFSNDEEIAGDRSNLPTRLRCLRPEKQGKLKAEDHMILLAEATLRDTFSASDSLTAEEVLPFAVRVMEDGSTNWQIYTQALLVRSRIELNRSRTMERGVLQMQAVVDQILVDTDTSATRQPESRRRPSVPEIHISSTDQISTPAPRLTTFLPAPQSPETASASVRLRYVHALASPPRWHLESELGYAWVSVGSLVSALDIFRRLRLWAEVALCFASTASTDDLSGRGAGGEEKARAILRWRLFEPTEASDQSTDDQCIDPDSLKLADWYGKERRPHPANAPRLFCILGDLEGEVAHYERAWEISKRRFARAQKSLGELYLKRQDWTRAVEAFRLAVGVNRSSPELWSRLGDIELRLARFPDAAEAYHRAVLSANGDEGGDGARTWSNLGTALLSWYRQVMKEEAEGGGKANGSSGELLSDPDSGQLEGLAATRRAAELGKPVHRLLADALAAFKRGATIAQDNWKIWDNVITLAASLSPTPALDDVILGTRRVLSIRKTEDALDAEILGLLVREVTKEPAPTGHGVYEPGRGTLPRKVLLLFEDDVIPLITHKSDVWALVCRLRAWRGDYGGALDAAEKAWRAATGGSSSSALSASAGSASTKGDWATDMQAWEVVVSRTRELVAAYENWGPRVEGVGDRWRGKARSALRNVLSRARESWQDTQPWTVLDGLMGNLKT